MAALWFTADTHFGHDKIRQHSKRPFQSVGEMDDTIIANWNAVVAPNDVVWHLGDFAFRNAHHPEFYRRQLHGHIHMVWGNHDEDTQKLYEKGQVGFASAQDVKYLRYDGCRLFLSHYAHRVWRNSHHGSFHLYGHSHGMLPDYHRSMDVGVDPQFFQPVPFSMVRAKLELHAVTLHHPELVTDPWDKD